MVNFKFQLNRSFLEYRSHPITVPRRYMSDLEHANLEPGRVTIVDPNGRAYSGRLYRGEGSGGAYYQVRTDAVIGRDRLSELPLREVVTVTIDWAGEVVEVRLAFSPSMAA